METWIYLFIIKQLLTSTCPYTIMGIGQLLDIASMFATIVFIILTFFFAPHWWYGLIACAIYLVVTMIAPRVNQHSTNMVFIIYSNIGSLAVPIIIVLMYLSLFGVI